MNESAPKPAWVESVDKASAAVDSASESITPVVVDAKLRIAYAWLDIAKLQKG